MTAPTSQVTIEHEGARCSGRYFVSGDVLTVLHAGVTKAVTLHGLPPESTARQILWEIVARDGRGKPD